MAYEPERNGGSVIPYKPEDANTTWPDGEYTATIESVTPKTSKAGVAKGLTEPNMHEVVLTVYPTQEGGTQRLYDYISYPKGTWKLEQIAESLGKLDAFKLKQFNIEAEIGKNVSVYLRTRDDPNFGAKNVVGEYLPMTSQELKEASKVASDEVVDPEMPF
jgi:hypothetical protein